MGIASPPPEPLSPHPGFWSDNNPPSGLFAAWTRVSYALRDLQQQCGLFVSISWEPVQERGAATASEARVHADGDGGWLSVRCEGIRRFGISPPTDEPS